ncbi:hypothetical protein GCM10010912_11890 [Paenibacillus albidus]|uniref:AzlD domain-containing protein n=1 Tax=Paenibacillus albidus TaxID=2041023 RepID=A0A917C559_9BACL|nr:AzlD domain-containing protein [Paenibacillus albidus]GGF68481.1 hypothetical protein GCM10010912_11890 [Paenibacillus albidus]
MIAIIAGMALITFVLRAAPLLLADIIGRFPARIRLLLDHLPIAVMSALIIPGITQVDPDSTLVGIVSGITAVILVVTNKMPLLLVILGAVASAVITKLCMLS